MTKIVGRIENGWTMLPQPEVFLLRQDEYEAMVSESDEEKWAFDWSIDIANDDDDDDEDDGDLSQNFVARGICRAKSDAEAKEQAMACVRAVLDAIAPSKSSSR